MENKKQTQIRSLKSKFNQSIPLIKKKKKKDLKLEDVKEEDLFHFINKKDDIDVKIDLRKMKEKMTNVELQFDSYKKSISHFAYPTYEDMAYDKRTKPKNGLNTDNFLGEVDRAKEILNILNQKREDPMKDQFDEKSLAALKKPNLKDILVGWDVAKGSVKNPFSEIKNKQKDLIDTKGSDTSSQATTAAQDQKDILSHSSKKMMKVLSKKQASITKDKEHKDDLNNIDLNAVKQIQKQKRVQEYSNFMFNRQKSKVQKNLSKKANNILRRHDTTEECKSELNKMEDLPINDFLLEIHNDQKFFLNHFRTIKSMDNFIDLQNSSVILNKMEWDEKVGQAILKNTLYLLKEEEAKTNYILKLKGVGKDDINNNRFARAINNNNTDFLTEKLSGLKRQMDEDQVLQNDAPQIENLRQANTDKEKQDIIKQVEYNQNDLIKFQSDKAKTFEDYLKQTEQKDMVGDPLSQSNFIMKKILNRK